MDAAIARYLPDFSAPPAPAAVAGEPDFSGTWFRPAIGAAAPAAPAPVEPEIEPFLPRPAAAAPRPAEDREAPIAAAEARGREEGRVEAMAEADARRAQERTEERAAFEERLTEARRAWTQAQGETLAAGFAGAMRALEADLSARIARLIAPVLGLALQRQALDELAMALKRILAEPQRAAVQVRGPEDLIAALAARLGALSAGIAFEADEGPDVTVSAGETVIETELAAWSRLIAAAIAEA
ncbi:MAG: hypothetical protein PGN25_08220 [Methylorubrum populi]